MIVISIVKVHLYILYLCISLTDEDLNNIRSQETSPSLDTVLYHTNMAFLESKKIIDMQALRIADLTKELQISNSSKINPVKESELQILDLKSQLLKVQQEHEKALFESMSEAWKLIDVQTSEISLLKNRIGFEFISSQYHSYIILLFQGWDR